jgi:hypothetical protein
MLDGKLDRELDRKQMAHIIPLPPVGRGTIESRTIAGSKQLAKGRLTK